MRVPVFLNFALVALAGLSFLNFDNLRAADEFEGKPILYSESTPDNRISRLQQKLDSGEVKLTYDDRTSYIDSLLTALDIPVASQMLVFSKTSLQMRRISPRTPRAIYFNDDVYVGFCQSGDVLEISAVDAQLGTVFYTMNQEENEKPQFQRRNDNCLVCHSSSRTEGVPGHLVRSLYVDASGQPLLSAGSRMVDHTTPIDQRWGGWYVTGTHGSQKHLGNLIVRGRDVQEPVDNSAGLNVDDLKDRFNVASYVSPHSDIVALMVLEHQVLVHNRIVKAGFDTRQALSYDIMMNKTLENPEGTRLESTTRRIKNTGDRLVEALLFVDEAKLLEPIKGTSGYTEQFAAAGPHDSRGRSLRDLDLTTRMLKFPCSYLIYSEAFDGLPAESRDYVWQRLFEILSGADQSEKFTHLSADDRQSILQILCETKSSLPDYYKNPATDI